MAELVNEGGETCTPDTKDTKSEELFRPLVTCGICLQLYVDPVALLNCLHLACGSCAKEWLKSSETCHQCREPVRGVRDSHHTLAVVEAYQSIAPTSSICQERTPEAIAALREQYKPGQKLTVGEEDEELSNGSSESSEAVPEFIDLEEEDERFELRIDSCPFCNPPDEAGSRFVCPQPCTQSDDDVGARTIPVGHTLCSRCVRFLPVREDLPGTGCTVCTRTTCSEFGETCRTNYQWDGELHLKELAATDFSSCDFPLTHAFGDNEFERDIFRTWVNDAGLSLQDVFHEILAFRGPNLPKATWHGNANGAISLASVNVDDKVCVHCALDLVEASLFDWWLSKRQSGVAELPEDATAREDCWYGIECRTARHNYRHASTYNHICRKTAADRPEESYDPPENGNRYVTESSELDYIFPAFSPSAILFRDRGKEPSFMCSSIRENGIEMADVIPGKVTIWGPGTGVQVYYGEEGREYTHHGQVQLLQDTRNMRWVRTSCGVIPEGCLPVSGGHLTTIGTQDLYHCAVWWRGQRIPGYTGTDVGRAVITWAGKEWYFKDNYEILCWN